MSGEFSRKTRDLIVERDGSRCQWLGCHISSGSVASIQHRRARGAGGTRDPRASAPSNGVLMCGTGTTGCHGFVEANPRAALERGFRVPQGVDPETVLIETFEGVFILDRYGGRTNQEVVF